MIAKCIAAKRNHDSSLFGFKIGVRNRNNEWPALKFADVVHETVCRSKIVECLISDLELNRRRRLRFVNTIVNLTLVLFAACFERNYLWAAEPLGEICVEVVVYQPQAYERGVRLTRIIARRDSTKTEMTGDQE